ncbi:MAG TPA: MlaE family lipid ABC transporter permease subunit [Thermohalobaculum sp.]|nr:MlaE family lipid ABC transporter permease subunit [Thermohalobaculum sp.]
MEKRQEMTEPAIRIDTRDEGVVLRLGGALVTSALGAVERALAEVPRAGPVVIDLSDVEALDTGGAWAITRLVASLEAEGVAVALTGASDAHRALIETVARSLHEGGTAAAPARGPAVWLETLGRHTAEAFGTFVEILGFFGLVMARLGGTLVRPRRLRLTSLVHHMQEVGLNAVPIVVLLAFLIGVVLAFQGAVQLRQFGAEVFVVNLIAISVLRELGILLTAIIVAGRSGSAFTAAIGSMKLREEIDAMRTIGLDPIEVLVLPRVLALILMLPVLGFIADVAGLVGGGLMSWVELGVSPQMFVVRLYETTDIWHLAIGFIKAPFFAAIIGVVGCYEGMKVAGSAESVGQRTTTSVVLAIFGVIVADALFSVFFAEIGV